MKYRFYQLLLVVAGFALDVGFKSVESDLIVLNPVDSQKNQSGYYRQELYSEIIVVSPS